MNKGKRWSNSYFEKDLDINPGIKLAQLEEILNQLNNICQNNGSRGLKCKINELSYANGFSVLVSDNICIINRYSVYLNHIEVLTHAMSCNRLELVDMELYRELKNFYGSEPKVVPV